MTLHSFLISTYVCPNDVDLYVHLMYSVYESVILKEEFDGSIV